MSIPLRTITTNSLIGSLATLPTYKQTFIIINQRLNIVPTHTIDNTKDYPKHQRNNDLWRREITTNQREH